MFSAYILTNDILQKLQLLKQKCWIEWTIEQIAWDRVEILMDSL